MLVKQGESRQDRLLSGTFDGISVGVYIPAAAPNTQLSAADWNPQNVQIKATLKRDKTTYVMLQDNLQLLGLFNTVLKGQFEFFNGIDLTAPAAQTNNVRLHTVKIFFGGPIRIGEGDELLIEVSIAKNGTFDPTVDSTLAYVEFEATPAIGYEFGVFTTTFQVVQQSTTKQSFNPGDNVTDLVFLNFDKNDFSSPVINNLNLSSDRLDLSMNFNQLLLNHFSQFDRIPNMRFGSSLPISESDANGRAFRGLDQYPQTLVIMGGQGTYEKQEIKGVRVDISFNSSAVAASQNYVAYRSFVTSQAIVNAAKRRMDKHLAENVASLPATLATSK